MNKNVEVHGASRAFISQRSLWTNNIYNLHAVDQSAGVSLDKSSQNKRLQIASSTDLYAFGPLGTKAYGVREQVSLKYAGRGQLNYQIQGEGAGVRNQSNDDYYNVSSTGQVKGSVLIITISTQLMAVTA